MLKAGEANVRSAMNQTIRMLLLKREILTSIPFEVFRCDLHIGLQSHETVDLGGQ